MIRTITAVALLACSSVAFAGNSDFNYPFARSIGIWRIQTTAPACSRADFVRLAVRLSAIAGKFLLSVNDVPEMREVFARFGIESVATRYTAAGGKWSDVAEIIVTGPSPHETMPPPPDPRIVLSETAERSSKIRPKSR
jgi:hypothetical protein